MISRQLSRRRLLRLIAASTAAAALAPALHARAHYPTALVRPQADDVVGSNDFVLMGRAIHAVTFCIAQLNPVCIIAEIAVKRAEYETRGQAKPSAAPFGLDMARVLGYDDIAARRQD